MLRLRNASSDQENCKLQLAWTLDLAYIWSGKISVFSLTFIRKYFETFLSPSLQLETESNMSITYTCGVKHPTKFSFYVFSFDHIKFNFYVGDEKIDRIWLFFPIYAWCMLYIKIALQSNKAWYDGCTKIRGIQTKDTHTLHGLFSIMCYFRARGNSNTTIKQRMKIERIHICYIPCWVIQKVIFKAFQQLKY